MFKHIKSLSILYILIIGILTPSEAQKNRFQEGKLYFTNNDVRNGYIKNLGELQRAQMVVFKKDAGDQPQTFYPKDIAGYLIGDQLYQSSSVQLKGNDNKIPVFLKFLVDGDALQLFQLNYKPREEASAFYQYNTKFYILKDKNQQRSLLLDKESSDTYTSQIPAYLEGCESVMENLKSRQFKFNDEGLTRFAEAYNLCRDAKSTIYTDLEKKPRTVKFIFKAGVSSGKISPNRNDYTLFDYNPQIRPAFSFLADIPLYKSLSLRGGLTYISRKSTGTASVVVSEAFDNEGEILELDAKIVFNHLAAPVSLVFTAPLPTIRPYLFAGGSFGVAIGNTAEGTRTNFMAFPGPPNQVLQYVEDIPPYQATIAAYDLAWHVGGGVTYPLNEKLDLLLEFKYVDGKNDASSDSAAFFSSKTMIITGGIGF